MKLSLIVALAENNTIGLDNKMPWHLPKDLKYFKKVTLGKPIIMGRKTYDSLGRPLPGRTNIVITRNKDYQPEGVKVVSTLAAAVELADNIAQSDGIDEAMIIGGAQIYELALSQVSRMYLTQVHAEVEGDAFFPDYKFDEWNEVSRESFSADGVNQYDYSFIVFDKK